MNYTLNNLGTNNFEHLVQALSKKIIGEGVKIYGAGPDGQRECTFEGKASYPSKEEGWEGYWVVQAKFKDPSTKKEDFLWLKQCFEEEMKNFAKKKVAGKKIPNNYLFFTNVVLTPVEEQGIKDKMDKLAQGYQKLIPHIHILGKDDICRYLDGHRDVAVAYASHILSGDVLSYLYQSAQNREKERQNAFFRYLTQAFNDDYCSRMEQAGQVTDEKVSIEKVYVDLKFKDEKTDNEGKFIEHAVRIGNEIFRFSNIESEKTIARGHGDKTPFPSNKYVLKGSAGQGKSTVCQFLAQIYRASFLTNFNVVGNPKITQFIENLIADGFSLPTCHRVPIRIELRLYSSWIIKMQKEEKPSDLASYISFVIREKSAEGFDNETLRTYLAKYSWAFFFDGLDEVPESSNRKEVMEEIYRFIEVELRQVDADAVFFATTRPEGYVGEFDKSEFSHLDLLPLDKESCFAYLNKLLAAIENDSTKRNDYFNILQRSWENDQIAFMMQTPLQATIITILIRAGGEPPRDKYTLFKEYFDIIIKREKQKGVESILNKNQELVEGVYYLLGYELQKKSSTTEGSDALIDEEGLKGLIKKQLDEDGIRADDENYESFLNETYAMIVTRINFASEIKEGYIGFAIRSIQEFLAAIYIVDKKQDEGLNDTLRVLARSAYWKNTFIFAVEYISKRKNAYYVDTLIDTILGELNGTALPVGEINAESGIYYGSQVAFTLLSNNIFKNKPRCENKLCKYMADYTRLQPVLEAHNVELTSDNVKVELTKQILRKPAEELTRADFCFAGLFAQEEKCKGLLKEFVVAHACEVVEQYLTMFGGSCPPAFYEAISLAINNGKIFDLNIFQIEDILKNVSGLETETAKRTLFKMLVKAIFQTRGRLNRRLELQLLNQYFGFDLRALRGLFRSPFRDRKEIFPHLVSVFETLPESDEGELDDLLVLTDQYGLNGLTLILKTVVSRRLEDYITFSEEIEKYKEEIEQLNEEMLIEENLLTYRIWRAIKYNGPLNREVLFSEEVRADLESLKPLTELEDFIREGKKECSLYRISVGYSFATFHNFYEQLKNLCPPEEIKKYPALCETLLFIYGCQYQNQEEEFIDEIGQSVRGVEIYLDEMLEYAKICGKYSYWLNYVWYISFLKMKPKDFMKIAEMNFYAPPPYVAKKRSFSIDEFDKSAIIENIIVYICTTENTSAFNLLFDLLGRGVKFETLTSGSWRALDDMQDKRTQCLAAISEAKSETDVKEKVLPLLADGEISDFVFDLFSVVKFPDRFMPTYLYYLQKYRAENNLEKIGICERKIKEFLTGKTVVV